MNHVPSTVSSKSLGIRYVCDDCAGHGYVPISSEEVDTCPKCKGEGLTDKPVTSGWYDDVIYVKGERYVRA
mgnify:CR=1 FL=1